MRKYIKYQKVVKKQRLEKMICDLCSKESIGAGWKNSIWSINETEIEITVRQTEGTNYPEGGFGTEYIIDLCPECFKNRLVPWLKSEGAKVEEKEWDW